MAEYLLSGRNIDGQTTTKNVEAGSADAAVAMLRELGFDDVVLHTDDAAALYTRQRELGHSVSPKEFIALRDRGGYLHNVFFTIRKIYARSFLALGVLLFFVVATHATGRPSWLLDCLAVGAFAFPLVYSPITWLFSTAERFDRLQEDMAWGRWEDALKRIPSIAGQLPPEEVAFQKATALGGLGRLEEAVETARPFGDGTVPEWLFLGRLASVFLAACDEDRAIECLEKAAAIAPENATLLLDLAGSLARYHRETVRARALLERARSHALSDLLMPVATLYDGIILFEEGKTRSAKHSLEEALTGFARFRKSSPLFGIFVDISRGYLTLVHAALHEPEAARSYFAAAEPRLRALKMTELTSRCDEALRLGESRQSRS